MLSECSDSGIDPSHVWRPLAPSAAGITSSPSICCAGRDPKPFPPPMKLCKEMVDAMGGADSVHYRRFRTLCCEAYNILRKSAGLILSLVHLMAGASITDIRPDPEKALLKLQVRTLYPTNRTVADLTSMDSDRCGSHLRVGASITETPR